MLKNTELSKPTPQDPTEDLELLAGEDTPIYINVTYDVATVAPLHSSGLQNLVCR